MPNVGIEIPKKASGQPVTAEEWNRLVEAVNLIRNVRGDEKYIAADAIGGSLVIRYKGPPVGAIGVTIPVQLTAAGSVTGSYQWREMEWGNDEQSWHVKYNGRTHADLGEAREVNNTGGLTTGTSSPTVFITPSPNIRTDMDGEVWEFTVSGSAGLFPVKVQQTGGSNGTNTTAATYTYTVRSIAWNGSTGGSTLGTGVAVTRPRMNGAVTVQSGSTGYGVAFMDGSTLVLWDAGEKLNTAGCT
jgi:formylglycine-generating enzyme required for sulfatase activity